MKEFFKAVIYGPKEKIEALLVADQIVNGNFLADSIARLERFEEIPETEFLSTSITNARHFLLVSAPHPGPGWIKIWENFFSLAETMGLSGEQVHIDWGPTPDIKYRRFNANRQYLMVQTTIEDSFPLFETKTLPIKII